MATSTPRDPDGGTVKVSSSNPGPTPPPLPGPLDPTLTATNNILELTSLNSNGGQPARLANLKYSNLVATANRGAQNAIANQQAHAQLTIAVLGKAANQVQNLGPLEARSSVDVLTDNATAAEIANLKGVLAAFGGGGGPGPKPGPFGNRNAVLRALQWLSREIKEINAANIRVAGSGTAADPYVVTDGLLYVHAPITLVFPNWTPAQIQFEMERHGVRIRG